MRIRLCLKATDARGRSALDMAALTGQTNVINSLQAKSAKFTLKSKMKHEANRRAREAHNYLDEVRGALTLGGFPTLNDTDANNLPLHAAVKYANLEDIAETLEDDFTTLNEEDSLGRTALDIAALTGQLDACTLLESKGGHYKLYDKWKMRAVARSRKMEEYDEELNRVTLWRT
jgi:ankyrin repeat protein